MSEEIVVRGGVPVKRISFNVADVLSGAKDIMLVPGFVIDDKPSDDGYFAVQVLSPDFSVDVTDPATGPDIVKMALSTAVIRITNEVITAIIQNQDKIGNDCRLVPWSVTYSPGLFSGNTDYVTFNSLVDEIYHHSGGVVCCANGTITIYLKSKPSQD
jgi:hypothetical protein